MFITKNRGVFCIINLLIVMAATIGQPGCRSTSVRVGANVDAGTIPDSHAQRAEDGEERPSKAQRAIWRVERDRWMQMQREDENGHVPLGALMRAMQHVDQMGGPGDDAGLRLRWDWLGPGNIGGRTRAVVINPINPDQMLLGGVTG